MCSGVKGRHLHEQWESNVLGTSCSNGTQALLYTSVSMHLILAVLEEHRSVRSDFPLSDRQKCPER